MEDLNADDSIPNEVIQFRALSHSPTRWSIITQVRRHQEAEQEAEQFFDDAVKLGSQTCLKL